MRRATKALLTSLALATTAALPATPVVLNEVLIDSKGSNPEAEFIELFSPVPGTDLGGLSIVLLEGSTDLPDTPVGSVIWRHDLPAGSRTSAEGLFLLANERAVQEYRLTPDITWPNDDRLLNDQMTILLMRTAAAPERGEVVGPTDAAIAGAIADSVGLVGPDGLGVLFFGAPQVGPDGRFIPAGAARVRDGQDTNTSRDFSLADIEIPPQSYNTPGRPNRLPEHMIANAGASAPPGTGGGAAPGLLATPISPDVPSVQIGNLRWFTYTPEALREALDQTGEALVYVRSSKVKRCRDFEQAYLLNGKAENFLRGRALFYLNATDLNQGSTALQLGVYRVPTFIRVKRDGAPAYLIITPVTTSAEVAGFLRPGT